MAEPGRPGAPANLVPASTREHRPDLLRESPVTERSGHANPVVHFEIGAADHQSLGKFYGELFGWGLREVSEGYTLVDTRGGGGLNGGIGRSGTGEPWRPSMSRWTTSRRPSTGPGRSGGGRCWGSPSCPAWPLPCSTTRTGCWSGWSGRGVPGAGFPAALGGAGAAVDWFEVLGGDAGRSQAFYAELFGWTVPGGAYGQVSPEGGPGMSGGIGAGGDRAVGDRVRRRGDVEATLARAEALGGTRSTGPSRSGERTRTGAFRDPAGNVFGVYHRGGIDRPGVLPLALALVGQPRRRPAGPAAAPARDLDVDVAIVGAGYTGLWTAYYLGEADPWLRIAVVERDIAGFGASGRNGGWCSALLPMGSRRWPAGTGGTPRSPCRGRCSTPSTRWAGSPSGRASTATTPRAGTSRWPPRPSSCRGCGAARRGPPLRLRRRRPAVAGPGRGRRPGRGPTAARRRLHPATAPPSSPPGWREGWPTSSSGEGSRSTRPRRSPRSSPGVRTGHGAVRAGVVVRATEGFTPQLPGEAHLGAPVYSLMVATEPLPGRGLGRAGHGARGRRSTTRATSSSTASAPPTGGWPSVVAAPPTTSARTSTPPSTATRRSSPSCARSSAPVPGLPTPASSRTPGVGPSASPATGTARSAWIGRPAWPGPAATSVTGSPPPTWPAAPSPS